VARDFERSFAAARVAYEGNDTRNALRELERARRAALKQRDEEQLRRVLDFADGSLARDEQTEIERENLLYSVRQNLRQVSRLRALRGGDPWEDPFPDLAAPQAHTRTFISRGVKFWIGVGVLFGTLLAIAFVVALIAGAFSSGGDSLRLRIRNDTSGRVTIDWCDTVACNGDSRPSTDCTSTRASTRVKIFVQTTWSTCSSCRARRSGGSVCPFASTGPTRDWRILKPSSSSASPRRPRARARS